MEPELVEDEEGLALRGSGMVLRGDFTRLLPRLRPDRLKRELLVRAAKPRSFGAEPVAVDATAGLGEDACLLAAAGFNVVLFERNPTMAALLRDAMRRARCHPQLVCVVARMHLVEQDSVSALAKLALSGWELPDSDPVLSHLALPGGSPDVVLLDPMFPVRGKSAAHKKKMQLFQQLEGPCCDEEALMDAARAANPRKIIVKRPVKGPHLAGAKPSYALAGKTVRYDCYQL